MFRKFKVGGNKSRVNLGWGSLKKIWIALADPGWMRWAIGFRVHRLDKLLRSIRRNNRWLTRCHIGTLSRIRPDKTQSAHSKKNSRPSLKNYAKYRILILIRLGSFNSESEKDVIYDVTINDLEKKFWSRVKLAYILITFVLGRLLDLE